MISYLIVGIVCLILGYFIGGNNPPASVKEKIVQEANNLLKK